MPATKVRKRSPSPKLSPGYDSGNSQPDLPPLPGKIAGTLPFIKLKKKKGKKKVEEPQKDKIVTNFMKEKRQSMEIMLKPNRNLKARNAVLRA